MYLPQGNQPSARHPSTGGIARTILVALLVAQGGLASGPARSAETPAEAKVIHTEPAQVGTIFVVEEGGLRYLRFDNPLGDDQSVFDPEDPAAVPMDYIRLALACLAHCDRVERVLMIGLGAGSFTTAVFRALPGVLIDAVEISPVVVRVAAKWFGLPRDPRYRIHLADGTTFVDESHQRWDAVFLDAYTEVDTPDLMRAQATFLRLKKRLRPGGVVLVNLAVKPDEENRALASLGAVFGPLTCYPTPDGDNLLVVGRADGRKQTREQVRGRLSALASAGKWSFDLVAGLGQPVACSSRRRFSRPGSRRRGPPIDRR